MGVVRSQKCQNGNKLKGLQLQMAAVRVLHWYILSILVNVSYNVQSRAPARLKLLPVATVIGNVKEIRQI
jgi:hypothetical protein